MYLHKYALVVALSLSVLPGCRPHQAKKAAAGPASSVKTGKNDHLNISILLDLSDRIDTQLNANPAMEMYERDLGYIQSVSKGFEMHLKAKPIRQDDDQIQVYFEPEPLDPQLNELAGKLKLSFTRDNAGSKEISRISSMYAAASASIYKLALDHKKYIGSDIWGFFKNRVNDYCIKPGHRNILFILTDGYVFHEHNKFMVGNKSSYLTPQLVKALKLNTSHYNQLISQQDYGFVPANEDLSQLEVFVLGVNPDQGNPFEGDVIRTYWDNWLKAMKVSRHQLKFTDLPANLDQVIQRYINP